MFRIVLSTLIVVMLATTALPVIPAHAQEGSTSFTITEDQINEAIADRDRDPLRYQRLGDVNVDLQPDTVQINGTFTTRQDSSFDATLSLVPQYVEGDFAGWAIAELSLIGDTQSGSSVDTALSNVLMGTWRAFERGLVEPNNNIVAVEITDDSIIYTLGEPLEGRRGVDINLQQGTLAITEAELNAMTPERFDEEGNRIDAISNFYVDLQADQVVISATVDGPRQEDGPYIVSATLVPIIGEDGVEWDVVSFEGYEPPTDAELNTDRDGLLQEWAMRWEPRQSDDFQVTDITITDTELVYTLEAR